MTDRVDWQVQVAFYLSLGSFLFGAFQWWHSEKEGRIKTTVEIGQKYIQDKDVYRQIVAWTKWEFSDAPWRRDDQPVNDPELVDRWSYIYYLNYIAYLIVEGKIDRSYLPPNLRCALLQAGLSMRKLKQNGRIHLDLKSLENLTPELSGSCQY
jgi:hypothetical protein